MAQELKNRLCFALEGWAIVDSLKVPEGFSWRWIRENRPAFYYSEALEVWDNLANTWRRFLVGEEDHEALDLALMRWARCLRRAAEIYAREVRGRSPALPNLGACGGCAHFSPVFRDSDLKVWGLCEKENLLLPERAVCPQWEEISHQKTKQRRGK